jgi:hypothetical protein
MRDAQLPIAGIRIAIRESPTSQHIYRHFVTTIMPLNGLWGQSPFLKSNAKVLHCANKNGEPLPKWLRRRCGAFRQALRKLAYSPKKWRRYGENWSALHDKTLA